MMRPRLCFMLAAAALLALATPSCVPEPAAAMTTRDVSLAMSGDSVQVTVFYTLRGGTDSAHYTVSSTNGKPAQTKTVKGASGSVGFMLLGPPEGETDTVTVTPTAFKLGRAFPQTPIKRPVTRDITAPPEITDSLRLSQAIDSSKFLDSAMLALTTGEMCPAELRGYHGSHMLIAPHGAQTADCQRVFNGSVMRDNLRTLAAEAVGYPWTARQDSIWRADTTQKPDLPNVFMITDYIPNPMSGDTLAVDGKNLVPIATYRASHPGFTWPSGT